jgi:serine/threonine protein kinase
MKTIKNRSSKNKKSIIKSKKNYVKNRINKNKKTKKITMKPNTNIKNNTIVKKNTIIKGHHIVHQKKFKHHFFKHVGHKLHGDKSVAGRAIASGGFGCVFSPELKCDENDTQYPHHVSNALERQRRVSKVMIKKYAIEEYEEIQAIRKKLLKVPNYSKYFLVDGFSLCKIKSFGKYDLLNFKKGCRALKRDEIDETNINSPENLDKLLALNMINGGIAVDEYIEKHIHSSDTLKKMNDSLIDLLLNGIVPMNHYGVYHCDIKDSNILIDKNKQPRLIDWGLTTEYHSNSSQVSMNNNKGQVEIPDTWFNRPFQYNVPFSVILFTDMFEGRYEEFLKKNSNNIQKDSENSLKQFLRTYIHDWKRERGLGHFELISHIVSILFKQEINNNVMINFNKSSSIKDSDLEAEEEEVEEGEIKESNTTKKNIKKQNMLHIIKKNVNHNFTTNLIIDYIYEILITFTKPNKTVKEMMTQYLDEVFIQIVDVWGFINTYYPLLEYYYDHSHLLTAKKKQFYNKLKYIFIEYLYKPRVSPVVLNVLVNDLKELDTYF